MVHNLFSANHQALRQSKNLSVSYRCLAGSDLE